MFWDQFILRVYRTSGEHHPGGLTAAARVLAEAHRQRLLDPASLDDLSVLLLLLVCPQGTALRASAAAEFTRRALGAPAARGRVRSLLLAAAPPRHAEVLTLFHRGDPAQRGLTADLLVRELAPPLALFLGRLLLTDPADQRQRAARLVARCLGGFGRIPLGTIDFGCYLYHHALDGLSAGDLPPAGPQPPLPPWFAGLPPDEQRFVSCCGRHLAPEARAGLYLTFYAGLNVRQVACVRSARQHWSEGQVLAEVEQSWAAVLTQLRQPAGSNGS
jgi:hypothetical protein